MWNRVCCGLIVLMLAGPLAAQEASNEDRDRQYVTDQLRLSLYEGPDSSTRVIKLLQSGDVLEIEQISGAYALVTDPDGTRGWVKRGFLVTEPTSNLLLLDEQQKVRDLEAEIEKLANSKIIIDQYEKDMDAMVEKIDALELAKQQAQERIAALQREIEAKQAELERKQADTTPPWIVLRNTFLNHWQYIVPLILLIIVLSYLVSKQIVEARIKSKFHGIKVW